MDNRDIAEEFILFTIKLKKYMKANMVNNKAFKLTNTQFRTLLQLNCLKKCTLKDLSKNIKVSTSSLCIMLNKMNDEGIVKRETDIKDRRNTFYSLTDNGEKILEEEKERIISYIDSKIKGLSDEKRIRLFESLNDLKEILDEM